MADYNIYIHNGTLGGQKERNQTVAWTPNEAQQTSAWVSKTQQQDFQGGNFASPVAIAAGTFSPLARSIPFVASAIVAVRFGIKTLELANEFSILDTGDYSFQIEWNNIRAELRALSNPVGTLISIDKMQRQIRNENAKRRIERDLLGDSILNTYLGRGV